MPGFPKRQLFVLASCRLAEPIAFTSVFPYLYNMIRDLKITDDEKKIAKYGGLVSSVYSLGAFLTGLAWGRASDVYGRKPIVLLGLIGTMIAIFVFGFSLNIYQVVLSRFAGGLLNGNVGVIRTVVAELVTERRHQATAFSIMPIVWQIGTIFGPAVGGALADPVHSYPSLFRGNKFLTKFPYALPNLVVNAILLISVLMGWLFIEETLEVRKGHEDTGLRVKSWLARQCCGTGRGRSRGHYRLASANSVGDELERGLLSTIRPSTSGSEAIQALGDNVQKDHPAPAAAPAPPMRELFTRQVTLNIVAYSLLSAHSTACDQIFPMFLATSLVDGGLSLEPSTIGICLSITGGIAMILQITIFPPIQRRLGSAWCFRTSTAFYSLVYLTIPFLQRLSGQPKTVVCAGVLAILFGRTLAGVFAFPSSAIMITNAVPTVRLLGSVNGLNQAAGSFMRMLGPAIFGFILSYSLEIKHIELVWSCLAALSAIGCAITFLLVEDSRKPELSDLDEGVTLSDSLYDTSIPRIIVLAANSFSPAEDLAQDKDHAMEDNDDLVDHLVAYEQDRTVKRLNAIETPDCTSTSI